jgi:hypothetical protein
VHRARACQDERSLAGTTASMFGTTSGLRHLALVGRSFEAGRDRLQGAGFRTDAAIARPSDGYRRSGTTDDQERRVAAGRSRNQV